MDDVGMAVQGAKTSASLSGSHGHDDDNRPLPLCPPHTTDRKLLARIDMRVVPFLCIMYLLAFLGKTDPSPHGHA